MVKLYSVYGVHSSDVPKVTLSTYLEKSAEKHLFDIENKKSWLRAVWLVDGFSRETILYKEMGAKSNLLAILLTKNGFQNGDGVLVCVRQNIHLHLLQFAVWKCGGIWRSIPASSKADTMVLINNSTFHQSHPIKIAVCDKQSFPVVEAAMRGKAFIISVDKIGVVPCLVELINELQIPRGRILQFPIREIVPHQDIALILNTKGTTGPVKAAKYTHRQLITFLLSYKLTREPGNLGIASEQCCINAVLLFLDATQHGEKIIWFPLHDELYHKDAPEILYTGEAVRVAMKPGEWSQLTKLCSSRMTDFWMFHKTVHSLGSNLRYELHYDLEKILPVGLINVNFCTAETLFITQFSYGIVAKPVEELKRLHWRHVVGWLSSSLTCELMDLTTNLEPGVNRPGILRLKSPYSMAGYVDGTHEGERWFRTNEVFLKTKESFFMYLGRFHQCYTIQGRIICPGYVELRMMAFPSVDYACVVPLSVPEPEHRRQAVLIQPTDFKRCMYEDWDRFLAELSVNWFDVGPIRGGYRLVKLLPIDTESGNVRREMVIDYVKRNAVGSRLFNQNKLWDIDWSMYIPQQPEVPDTLMSVRLLELIGRPGYFPFLDYSEKPIVIPKKLKLHENLFLRTPGTLEDPVETPLPQRTQAVQVEPQQPSQRMAIEYPNVMTNEMDQVTSTIDPTLVLIPQLGESQPEMALDIIADSSNATHLPVSTLVKKHDVIQVDALTQTTISDPTRLELDVLRNGLASGNEMSPFLPSPFVTEDGPYSGTVPRIVQERHREFVLSILRFIVRQSGLEDIQINTGNHGQQRSARRAITYPEEIDDNRSRIHEISEEEVEPDGRRTIGVGGEVQKISQHSTIQTSAQDATTASPSTPKTGLQRMRQAPMASQTEHLKPMSIVDRKYDMNVRIGRDDLDSIHQGSNESVKVNVSNTDLLQNMNDLDNKRKRNVNDQKRYEPDRWSNRSHSKFAENISLETNVSMDSLSHVVVQATPYLYKTSRETNRSATQEREKAPTPKSKSAASFNTLQLD